MNTPEMEQTSQAANAAALNDIIARHSDLERRTFSRAERLRILTRGMLKGWLRYPHGRTPASCIEDGLRLERALIEGDKETIRELGCGGRGLQSLELGPPQTECIANIYRVCKSATPVFNPKTS